MGSQILQNPSNPDATYREKAGKQNRGDVYKRQHPTSGIGSEISGNNINAEGIDREQE